MIKRTFLFLLFTLYSCISFSQSFYEFNYFYAGEDGSDKDEYKALMLRNADGTGIMRVTYINQATKSMELMEMTIKEEYGLQDDNVTIDSNMLILQGSDVRYIVGNSNLPADHFIFVKDEKGFYEPASVMTFMDDTTTLYGTFERVRLLNDADLTEQFILQYFTKDEDFYKDLFETQTRSLNAQEKQTRLFLLLVANTNDKKIGKTCEVDLKNTFDTYKELTEFLGIQLMHKVISGNEFSKVNVDNALNSMRPAPNDIVVFYYTGHGFGEMKDNYRFPYLDLRDKSYQDYGGQYAMNMEAIFQKIKMKGARLNLVISDCCNNDPSQSQNMTSEDPETKVSSIGWDKNKCIDLFLAPRRQSILATAAQKGELSAGNISEGGFFTSNFLQSLEKHIGKVRTTKEPLQATWTSIISLATNETTTRAYRKPCRMPDESIQRCTQHPVYRME